MNSATKDHIQFTTETTKFEFAIDHQSFGSQKITLSMVNKSFTDILISYKPLIRVTLGLTGYEGQSLAVNNFWGPLINDHL